MSAAMITRSDSHEYTVDGRQFDGVTTVIGNVIRKPALEKWIGDLGNVEAERVRTKAASHGTLVHALATLAVEGTPSIPMGETAPAQAQLDAFMDWCIQFVEEVYAAETMVAHPHYRYAGAFDFLLRMKRGKGPVLIDVKTGKSVYPEMRYQTAAYREAAKVGLLKELELSPATVRRGVLHIPTDDPGRLTFHEHTRHVSDFQGFLSCLFLYRDLKRGI